MIKQNIFKTIGLLTLLAFTTGIFFLSVRNNQVQARDVTKNGYKIMEHMADPNVSHESHNRLTSEQKKEMIDVMKQHHGESWQNHHQHIHGYDNGI